MSSEAHDPENLAQQEDDLDELIDQLEKKFTDLEENIKNRLEIIPVKWIDQVLDLALESKPQPLPEEVPAPAVAAVAENAPSPSVITH